MSIRHYNPRRRRRGGISPKARNFLFLLVGVTIALQISYPLITGETLRIVTIATVYVGAMSMVIHGHLSYGAKYSTRYLPITALFGYRSSWSSYRLAFWNIRIRRFTRSATLRCPHRCSICLGDDGSPCTYCRPSYCR
jgi:hypothetical protein